MHYHYENNVSYHCEKNISSLREFNGVECVAISNNKHVTARVFDL